MKKNKKIVLIGAGSAMFTRGLVADLILSLDWRPLNAVVQPLSPLELGLVDIDPQALETAEKLSKRMVDARNAEIAIQASTDRCDILPGADVVAPTPSKAAR